MYLPLIHSYSHHSFGIQLPIYGNAGFQSLHNTCISFEIPSAYVLQCCCFFQIWIGSWNSKNSYKYKSIVRNIDHTYNLFDALLDTIWLKFSFSWVDPKAHNSLALLAYFSKRTSCALRRTGHDNGFPYGRFLGLQLLFSLLH